MKGNDSIFLRRSFFPQYALGMPSFNNSVYSIHLPFSGMGSVQLHGSNTHLYLFLDGTVQFLEFIFEILKNKTFYSLWPRWNRLWMKTYTKQVKCSTSQDLRFSEFYHLENFPNISNYVWISEKYHMRHGKCCRQLANLI